MRPLIIDEEDVTRTLSVNQVNDPTTLAKEAEVEDDPHNVVVIVLVLEVVGGRQHNVHRILHLEEHEPVRAKEENEREKEDHLRVWAREEGAGKDWNYAIDDTLRDSSIGTSQTKLIHRTHQTVIEYHEDTPKIPERRISRVLLGSTAQSSWRASTTPTNAATTGQAYHIVQFQYESA